jgi:hypothetical protein
VGEIMKLFALHSPAIRELWENFSESVIKKTSFEFCPAEIPSQFDGVVYGQPIYYELLKWLIQWRIDLVNKEKEVFVTSGADTEFYGDPVANMTQLIEGKDLLAANDDPTGTLDRYGPAKLCSCLYVIRPGPNVTAFFQKICDDPRAGRSADDPIANEIRDMVRWGALPHNLYWNTLKMFNKGGIIPQPPKEMLWFHANYTIGYENKLEMMQKVREAMRK